MDFWISTRFPFGFFQRGERVGAKGEVLVYPLVLNISSFFHLLPFLPGPLEGLQVGPGDNLILDSQISGIGKCAGRSTGKRLRRQAN